MNPIDEARDKPLPPEVRWVLVLLLLTSLVSLAYAIQYYQGGPVRLSVASPFYDVDYSSVKSLVAAAVEDGTVRVWEVPPDARTTALAGSGVAREPPWKQHVLSGHRAPVLAVGFSTVGTRLYSIDRLGQVWQWDLEAFWGQPLRQVGGEPLVAAEFSGQASVATAAQDGTVRVTDLTSGQTQSLSASGGRRLAVAISADGSMVAAGSGSSIQVWRASTGEQVWSATKHTKDVTALAFSPDGTIVASGGADRLLLFWDVLSGQLKATTEGHWGAVDRIVFDGAGSAVLTGSTDNFARTFRWPGGNLSATYKGHLSAVRGVAFGPPAGQETTEGGAVRPTIFTASSDGTMRHWEPASQYVVHLEWSHYGFEPTWGRTLAVWMLLSGGLGLLCLWGLWRRRIWGHLLALGLYLLGPIAVLGLPLTEVLLYPLSPAVKFSVAWPLLLLGVWYILILVLLTREPVQLAYEAPVSAPLAKQLMTRQRTVKTRLGLYGLAVWVALLVVLFSVLRRFNMNVAFMGHYLPFIMKGAWLTLWISAASIALAIVLALLGALGRLSKNPIANGISGFYISLIRGTPLLVQIFIWYLGLPQLGIVIEQPEIAGVLALGVNYGAYMTEVFRAGIQAIGKGQHEAAAALGMSRAQTLRRIVLPQAFRIVIPPIGNEFIAMMKDSSLVSVMSVWELTYRAQKLGRQYFRNMETFIIAAAFYWVLTVVFQFLQGKLEDYMARSERR